MHWLQKKKWGLFFRTVIWTVLITFTVETFGYQPAAYAQSYLQSLPLPGTSVSLSPAYAPVLMKGIKTYPDNPFRFDFLIDAGQQQLNTQEISEESQKLIKYFLASLTVPENDLWVNLSPYEKDRIMPTGFGVTEMGRDLLAQDYFLKQISASLLDPTTARGEEFWKKIYNKAAQSGGQIPNINTFNKVWIIPDFAEVYTKDGNAFVVDSHLKVMLEEDFTAMQKTLDAGSWTLSENNFPSDQPLAPNDQSLTPDSSSQTIREVIVPAIEKEVNEGENFAILRQIYHAMILATWFKRHLRNNLFSKVYVGQNKVAGVDVDDKEIKEKIYQQYLAAFQKGAFHFIREDYDPVTDEMIPRKYFAGGVSFTGFALLKEGQASAYRETSDLAALRRLHLQSVGYRGGIGYRVSSVVVNPQGVNWYNRMQLIAPKVVAASAIMDPAKIDAGSALSLSVGKLFRKTSSLRKAIGIALSTILLFSTLGFATQTQAAQFDFQKDRGIIIHVETNDTLGDIVQTLKAQKVKGRSDLLDGHLWGKSGTVEKVAQAMQISDQDKITAGKTYVIPASFLNATDVSTAKSVSPAVPTAAEASSDQPVIVESPSLPTTDIVATTATVSQASGLINATVPRTTNNILTPHASIVTPMASIVAVQSNIISPLNPIVQPINSMVTVESSYRTSFLSNISYPIDIEWIIQGDLKIFKRSLDNVFEEIQSIPPAVSWTLLGLMLVSFGLLRAEGQKFEGEVKKSNRLPADPAQPLVNWAVVHERVVNVVRAVTLEPRAYAAVRANAPSTSEAKKVEPVQQFVQDVAQETLIQKPTIKNDFIVPSLQAQVPTDEELAFAQKGHQESVGFTVPSGIATVPDQDEVQRAQQILAQRKSAAAISQTPATSGQKNLPGAMGAFKDESQGDAKGSWRNSLAAGIAWASLAGGLAAYFSFVDHVTGSAMQWFIIACGNFGIYWVEEENEKPAHPQERIYPRWVSVLLGRHLELLTLRGGESSGMMTFAWSQTQQKTAALVAKVLKAKRGGDLFKSLDRKFRKTVKKAVGKNIIANPTSRVRGLTGHVRLPTGGPSLLEAAHPFTTTDNQLAAGLYGLWRKGQGDFAMEDNWVIQNGRFASQPDQVIVSIAANGDNLRAIAKFKFSQTDPKGNGILDSLIAQGKLEEVAQDTVRLVRNEDGSASRPIELKEAQYDDLWDDLQKSDLQVTMFGQELDTDQLRDYYAEIYQYELGDAHQWVNQRDEYGQLPAPHRIVNGDSPPIALQILFGLTQGNWKSSVRYSYTNAVHRNRQEVVDHVMTPPQMNLIAQFVQGVFVEQSDQLARLGLSKENKGYVDLWVTQEMVDADALWASQFQVLEHFRATLLQRLIELRDEISDGKEATAQGILIRQWRRQDDQTLKAFVDLLVERFFTGDRATSVREFAQVAKGTFGVQAKDSLHPNSFTLYANEQGLAIGYSTAGRYVEFSSEHSAMMYDHGPRGPLENIIFLDSQAPGQMADVTVFDNKNGPLFSLDVYSFAENRSLTHDEILGNSYPQTEDSPYFRKPLAYKDPSNKTKEDLEKIPAIAAELRRDWDNEHSHARQTAAAMLNQFVARDLETYLKSNSLVYGRRQGEITNNLGVIIDNVMDTTTSQGREAKARILHEVQNDSIIPYFTDYLDRIIEQKSDELAQQMISQEITEDDLSDIQDQFERSLQLQFYRELKRIGQRIANHDFKFFQQWLDDAIAQGGQDVPIGAGEIDAVSMGYESSQYLGEALDDLYHVVFPKMRRINLSSNEALSLSGNDGIGRRTVAMVTSKSGGTAPSKGVVARLMRLMPGRVFASTSRADTLVGFALGQKYLKDSPFCQRIFYTGDYYPSEAISAGEISLFINNIELVIYLAKHFRQLYPHRQPFGMTMNNDEIAELERLRDDILVEEAERLVGVNARGEPQATEVHEMLDKKGEHVGKTILEGPFANLYFRLFVIGIFLFAAPAQNLFEWVTGVPLPSGLNAMAIAVHLVDAIIALLFQWQFTVWIYRWFSQRPRWARLSGTTLAVNDPSVLVRESGEMYAVKLGSQAPASMHMHVLSTDPTDSLAAKLLPRIARGTLALFGMPYESTAQDQVALSIQQVAAVKNGILGQFMKAGAEIFVIFRGKDAKNVPAGAQHKMNIGAPDIHVPTPRVLDFYHHSFDVYGRLIAEKVFLESAYRYATTFKFGKWMVQIWDRSKTFFRTGVLSTAIPRMKSEKPVEFRGADPLANFSPKKEVIAVEQPALPDESADIVDEPAQALVNQSVIQSVEEAVVPVASSTALTTTDNVQAPGGIDLNPRLLKINITGASASTTVLPATEFVLDPSMLNAMPSDRFVPLIIEVVPVATVDMFLGMFRVEADALLAAAVE